jgi:hypothetical protein
MPSLELSRKRSCFEDKRRQLLDQVGKQGPIPNVPTNLNAILLSMNGIQGGSKGSLVKQKTQQTQVKQNGIGGRRRETKVLQDFKTIPK